MLKRTISGIVLVAIMVTAILWSPYSFAVLFGIVTFLSLWEYYHLFENYLHIHINKPVACLGGVYLFFAGFLYFSNIVSSVDIFLPWMGVFLYLSISELFKKERPDTHTLAYTFMGQIYIALPMMLMCRMAFQETIADVIQGEVPEYSVMYSSYLILSFYILVWVSDTMAYLCGRVFGKHPLAKHISPKKTWEGFIGGLLFSVGTAVLLSYFYPIMTLIQWIGFALTTTIFGLFGDLYESSLKRKLQLKDSGNIIPGHGGMLDRFDSELIAIPAVVIYLFFIL